MVYNYLQKLVHGAKLLETKQIGAMYVNALLYHYSGLSHQEPLPREWYDQAFPKIIKLSHSLRNVDWVDGRLVDASNDSIVYDDQIEHRLRTFKSMARVFIGSPSVQQVVRGNVTTFSAVSANCTPLTCFSAPSEREPMIVNSLTKVSNFLNISAQQRKLVRLTVCPQVTQQRIWIAALEEILNGLKIELDLLTCRRPSKGTEMGQQIVSSCLKFLDDTAVSSNHDSTSWMRLVPAKVVDCSASHKWEDVLEMFNDLIDCLKSEKDLCLLLVKLEVMKEGLSQIKDVLIDKSIGYKEARHQESLVQKKLSKTLGHSSKCLFTLLLYYLCGHVRDIEVDICGGIYSIDEDRFCLCMGSILITEEEKIVRSGVRQLDRALRLFKFVWETAGMKAVLEPQGHLWCVGAEGRVLTYRENMYLLHGINL
ncbi:hypothetical protein I3843_05G234300 [Carya illinoinensis]|nr:hypothetical protein I3760_05G258800 [Carya illinoinensis]KAG2709803.1 hypothetical protein I3760_05G258800 [Carya illinoinensis]KAG2709804.1 hypothetical protein I3760_05G258800 [Carya illinoinensis]KAG7981439.1 hypothetical protein I3843_05G234300 [Carya illinoinensis]